MGKTEEEQKMKTTIDPTRELLPHIVDHKATVNPDDTYAEFPISELTYDEGYRRVTYQNLANVINGLAWWLQENFGTPPDKSVAEVIPYLGPNDLRYYALILAAVKVGYCVCVEKSAGMKAVHLKNRSS
jgi:acyl-CoA synthetase (AMP-forming)/AMP-acid ligase II